LHLEHARAHSQYARVYTLTHANAHTCA
jgi:hypothetical protein